MYLTSFSNMKSSKMLKGNLEGHQVGQVEDVDNFCINFSCSMKSMSRIDKLQPHGPQLRNHRQELGLPEVLIVGRMFARCCSHCRTGGLVVRNHWFCAAKRPPDAPYPYVSPEEVILRRAAGLRPQHDSN